MLKKILLTTLMCCWLGSSAAQNAPLAKDRRGDAIVLDMQQAYKRGDKFKLSALLPSAQGHILEPWAAYWELRARLDTAAANEVQAFLQRYAGTYQEDRLRNDWLLLLGQRQDWATFAREHPLYRMNDDAEVRCYALLIEHAQTGADTSAEVRRRWWGQRDVDDGCSLAAQQLYSEGRLHTKDIWQKARMAVEANKPQAARRAVQIVSPDAGDALNRLLSNPQQFLKANAVAISQQRKELTVLALIKLATQDSDAAANALEQKWGPQLSAAQRHWAWAVIGKQSAQNLSPNAAGYFDKAQDKDLSDDLLAWKVRAALRANDWQQVRQTIDAMSEDARKETTWVYWKAKALKTLSAQARRPGQHAQADAGQAQALFESITATRDFYEQLALEELGRPIVLPPAPASLTAQERQAAARNPGLQRAIYAIQIGLRSEGVREWNYSTNLATPGGMSDRELLAAAQWACDEEIWDRCINTSERTKTLFDAAQRYPTPLYQPLLRQAQLAGVEVAYAYGLIRQESRFVMNASSSVGASGLMQVMPATAQWVARKTGMQGISLDQLSDRDTNLALGTRYLRLVLDSFDGSGPVAAAAYNAGPSRARRWRAAASEGMDVAVWAETIPFSETRDYVKKVMANTNNYAVRLSGQPQSLRARLGSITPSNSAPVVADLP